MTKDPDAIFTSATPSGLEIEYRPHPRRYRIRCRAYVPEIDYTYDEWQEVPSVTTILDVLYKPGLTWWGQKVGSEGVLELIRRGLLQWIE